MKWLYCWKSRGETFFQRDSIPILVSRTVKLRSSNCCIFEMKLATGMETCSKIYFLFIFNLVSIRIRKTSLFWLYNLMTSLWKPNLSYPWEREKASLLKESSRHWTWKIYNFGLRHNWRNGKGVLDVSQPLSTVNWHQKTEGSSMPKPSHGAEPEPHSHSWDMR